MSAVALAFVANRATWSHNFGAVARALRERYGAGDEAVAFFEFFAASPPGFEERSLGVAQAALDGGDDPAEAGRATRLLQAYELLLFWDAAAQPRCRRGRRAPRSGSSGGYFRARDITRSSTSSRADHPGFKVSADPAWLKSTSKPPMPPRHTIKPADLKIDDPLRSSFDGPIRARRRAT